MKPKVIIQTFPIRNRAYFEWIVTGLQILHESGEIELSHEGSSWDRMLRREPRIYGRLEKHFPELSTLIFPVDHFTMCGRLEVGGRSSRFAYDATDSPFTFALAHLELVDRYFKMQCPITIDAEGYPLNRSVRIPYHPLVLQEKAKILPAMSTGAITNTLNLKKNLQQLHQQSQIDASEKRFRIFASFGGDKGPPAWQPSDVFPAPHNFRNERSIVSLMADQTDHPNQKRARIVRILRNWQRDDVDARIWNSEDPEIQGPALKWSAYLERVAQSVFNVNVSGFRRSLPFRFIDSFQVGCGILTDTMGTRWYQPFDADCEVMEYGDLGYEKEDAVDWSLIEERMRSICEGIQLDNNRSREIRHLFERKWHPRQLARYFVDECLKAL